MKVWLVYDEYHDEIDGVALSIDKVIDYLVREKINLDEDIVCYHDFDSDEDRYTSVKIASHWEECQARDFLERILLGEFENKYWFPWQLEEMEILE